MMSPLSLVLLAIVFILLIFWLLLIEVPSFRTFTIYNKLPGPRGYPLIGSADILIKVKADEDIMDIFSYYIKKYPRILAAWIMGIPAVVLSHPEDLQILMSSIQHIQKGFIYSLVSDWLQEGLLLSYGNKWHARRKALTPAFHFKILEGSLQVMIRNSKILVERLKACKGQTVDLESYISLFTLDVMSEASMGINIEAQNEKNKTYVQQIKTFSKIVIFRILKPWLFKKSVFYFSSTYSVYNKAVQMLHNFSTNVIKERKKTFILQEDEKESQYYRKRRMALLDCLLELEAKNPGSFTLNDIREEVDTFLFRGHDTTTAGIVFSLFSIANNSYVQELVFKEQKAIFGDDDRDITPQDLQDMVYLEKVIKETLRIFPSVPFISRRLTTDLVLHDGTVLPAGIEAAILPYFTHRLPDLYPDPEKFDPERFSEEQCEARHPFAYIPFSAGPRNCIGQKFAMMELKAVLSYIIRSMKLEPVTKREEFKLIPYVILRPSKPIKCKFIPRN